MSGDIPDAAFFKAMVSYAACCPQTQFLCFTKQFEIVNDYIAGARKGYRLSDNLHVIFSEWPGFEIENPYNLPTSTIYQDGDTIPEEWLLCGGNCTECACRGVGCWQIQNGQTIAFKKH